MAQDSYVSKFFMYASYSPVDLLILGLRFQRDITRLVWPGFEAQALKTGGDYHLEFGERLLATPQHCQSVWKFANILNIISRSELLFSLRTKSCEVSYVYLEYLFSSGFWLLFYIYVDGKIGTKAMQRSGGKYHIDD